MTIRQLMTGLAVISALEGIALEPAARQDKDGNYILENRFIRAKIAPQGGRIVWFEDKIRAVNHTFASGSWAGFGKVRMFEDHSCTEFFDQDYKMKILRAAGDKAVVECTYLAKRKDHPWHGFEVIKRYSLKEGENRLGMEWVINSYGSSGRLTPFLHNYLRIRDKSFAFAQTADGSFCREIRAANSRERTCMVRNLSEHWGAVITPAAQTGMLGYDASDSVREMLFWLDESKPTFEPVFETARFGMNSSWSCRYWFAPLRDLKSCHFASADYAGGFCIENAGTVMKFLPLSTLGKTKLKLYRENRLLQEFEFDTEPGKTLTFPADLKKGLQKIKITIEYQKKTKTHDVWVSPLPEGMIKEETQLKKETHPDREYAKCHVPKGKMFVTPDMTVPLGFFAVKNKLSKIQAKSLKLVIDAPEGIMLMNPMAHYGNCHKQISRSPVSIDGQPYIRHEIPQVGFRNTVFASTNWPAGKKGIMYYQLKWQNGEDERKSIPVESLSIPHAPFPKLLITNIPGFGMLQKYIDCWPGFYEAMRHVGCNTLSSSASAVRDPGSLQNFFRKARSGGFYTFANFLPFHLADRKDIYSEDIRNFCAVSLNGKSSKWPCPSYRGKAFQDHVEQAALPGKLGATMLALDTEMWSGADYCFCDRCMDRFKEYMAKNHPDKKYLSPKTFRNDPENYPEYNKIWDDFKAMLGCEMYREIVSRFQKNLQAAGTPGPYMVGTYDALPSGTIYSMFLRLDDLLREKLVNHVQPSPYTRGNALKFADSVRRARKTIGNSNILTWMSAGGVYPDDEYPARDFRYCLLENFANGARGYLILPWYGSDAEDLKEHAAVMQMVVPLEDIVLEGTVLKELPVSNSEVKICGLRKGREQLILVSEYYDAKPTPVSFTITAEENAQAIDMLTGEVIAPVVKGINTVRMTIPADDRAILIYIGNRKLDFSGRQKRQSKIAGTDEKKPSSSAQKTKIIPPKNTAGKLIFNEKNLTVANDFYKITFFSKSPYSELEFTKSDRKMQFYLTNSIQYGTKRFTLLSPASKREVRKSPDGRTIELIFSEKYASPGGTITSRIKYTFWNDRPVIGFSGKIELESASGNTRIAGSLNSWWFQPVEEGKSLHRYCSGPVPHKTGLLADRSGSIEAPWKKKYKYFALCDGQDAFGMITPSQENASIYVGKKKNGYITGSRIKMDGGIFCTEHYLYAGPESELPVWAETIYTSPQN